MQHSPRSFEVRSQAPSGKQRWLRSPSGALTFVLFALAACGPEQVVVRSVTSTEVPGSARPDAGPANRPTEAGMDAGVQNAVAGEPSPLPAPMPLADAGLPETTATMDGPPLPVTDAAGNAMTDAGPAQPPTPDAASAEVIGPPADAANDAAPARLVVASDPPQNDTDLTDVGRLDWVHFGLGNASEPNRKRNATRQIRWSLIGMRALGTYDDRPVEFRWRDGVPMDNARTRHGITTGGEVGVGYRLRFDGPLREGGQMFFYGGAWNARAELRVRLRNTGVPMEVRSLDARAPGRDRAFTISFGPLNDDE
ncbi:MAG TPA: hypothetical protein VGF45_19055, partial [Polyangia bacterium]